MCVQCRNRFAARQPTRAGAWILFSIDANIRPFIPFKLGPSHGADGWRRQIGRDPHPSHAAVSLRPFWSCAPERMGGGASGRNAQATKNFFQPTHHHISAGTRLILDFREIWNLRFLFLSSLLHLCVVSFVLSLLRFLFLAFSSFLVSFPFLDQDLDTASCTTTPSTIAKSSGSLSPHSAATRPGAWGQPQTEKRKKKKK